MQPRATVVIVDTKKYKHKVVILRMYCFCAQSGLIIFHLSAHA